MNKIVILSLLTAVSIMMTGCGSSSGTSSNPTAVPTAIPTATPLPTVTPVPTVTPAPTSRPEAQPAPVTPVSIQQLLINTPVLQTTNMAMAASEATKSLISSVIVQYIVDNILQPVNGDLPCSVLGVNQGSGSIHGEAKSLPAGGNAYTLDFNECTFDTQTTLSTIETLYADNTMCKIFVKHVSELFLKEGPTGLEIDPESKLDRHSFMYVDKYSSLCRSWIGISTNKKDIAEDLKDALQMLIETTAISNLFKEHFEDLPDIGVHTALNDTLHITGSLYAELNLNSKPAGNIWTSTFSADKYNMTLVDNMAQTTKYSASIDGKLTGNVNSKYPLFNPTPADTTIHFHVDGTNNLSSKIMLNSTATNNFIDSAIVGENATYSLDMIYSVFAGSAYPITWDEISDASFNDSGDGFVKATFNDNAAAYHGEFSLYNKNFIQKREVITDPTADTDVGIARKSTYTVNGVYGLNTQGTPFVWNTQGAFTFHTNTIPTKTKINGVGTPTDPGTGTPWDYQIKGGEVTIAGNKPIDFKFLPDLSANPNDGNGLTDGNIVMSVDGDLITLPANIVSWLEVVPQP